MKCTFEKFHPGGVQGCPAPFPQGIKNVSDHIAEAERPLELADVVLLYRGAMQSLGPNFRLHVARTESIHGKPGEIVGMIRLTETLDDGGKNHWRVCVYVCQPHPRATTCRSCKAAIVWLKTASGKSMPADADFVEANAELFEVDRYLSHFATCPNANSHRRR